MKKLDSKFLITCGVIISLPLIFILFMALIRGCSGGKTYDKYQEMMVTRAKSYAKNHKMLPKKGKSTIIKLDNLIDDGMKSPEKSLKDDSCSGSVVIKNNSTTYGEYYSYIPYLECDNYKTEYLKDYLMKDIVDSGSGLYKIGDEYIFKGNKVNNYLSLYGTIYRIIKIDANGNLKLVKTKSQEISTNWDNKFNINKNSYDGVNNYRDSIIIDRLVYDYKNDKTMTDDVRGRVIPHSICIGKRNKEDLSLGITSECSDKLDNQLISLLSVSDYNLASYDVNCKNMGDLSCTNFNYMTSFIDETWTLDTVSNDDSMVYILNSIGPEVEVANNYKKYNWVIYIDGEELYNSGKGTEKDPYIIK